jgi:hypothetical protein
MGTATQVNLLSNSNVAVAGHSTIVNSGNTILNGNLTLSTGSVVTGFPPGVVNGTQFIDDSTAVQSQLDVVTAYNQAANETPADAIAVELGLVTLTPGIYSGGTFSITTGNLTLDAGGDSSAVWVFQSAATLNMDDALSIVLINGAQATNVFWQVGSSATIGANDIFMGTIMALASISVGAGTTVNGGLLVQTGSVTLNDDTINVVASVVVPTVTTQAETSVTALTATANGNITVTGGANATLEGFVYDIVSNSLPGNVAPGSSGYAYNISTSGSFGAGAFTGFMAGLSAGTTYYVRAFAENSAGYSYGAEISFTTSSLAIPGIIHCNLIYPTV